MVSPSLSRYLLQNEPVRAYIFKECFLLAGYDSTIGVGKLIGLKSPKDCSVIEMLKAQVKMPAYKVSKDESNFIQGAVPFCLTNIPQTMVTQQFLASPDALEVIVVTESLSHSLSVSTDLTDVTLVSDDTYCRLD